ncbi:lipopolysaccharide biosynthesis protein [Brevundimonas staleyi]|uniref:Lipopolysaccharide biosynthesis protein n=1 Tax=Brevundimonas staleyi TaxID=74326 RepID=A0ABW0FM83_9CAUL
MTVGGPGWTGADLFSDGADRLKQRAAVGASLSLLARGCRVASQIATFVILARLLSPEDFGLVGMLLPFIAIVSVAGDLGMSTATLQSARMTPGQASALFYLNMASGVVLAAGFAMAAPLLAGLFAESRVVAIGLALSLVFPLTGLAGQHQALLQRSLNFRSLLIADIAAALGASVLAIGAALIGWGYWAIVVRVLAQPAVYAMAVWGLTPWRPGRPDWRAGRMTALRLGGFNLGFSLLTVGGRQLDNILIGWRWGEAALGPYALAYRLFFTPVQQLSQPLEEVMVPTLSKLRDDPARYRRGYLGVLRMLALVGAPPLIAVSVAARDVIVFTVGADWLGAVEILRWLAPIGAIHVASVSLGWLNLSLERSRRQFLWALITVPIYVAGFVIGLSWGAVGVAQGYFAASLLTLAPGVVWACRGSPVRPWDFVRALIPAAVASVVVGGTAAVTLGAMDGFPVWLRLIAIGGATLAVMAAGLAVVVDRDLVRSLIRKREAAA